MRGSRGVVLGRSGPFSLQNSNFFELQNEIIKNMPWTKNMPFANSNNRRIPPPEKFSGPA